MLRAQMVKVVSDVVKARVDHQRLWRPERRNCSPHCAPTTSLIYGGKKSREYDAEPPYDFQQN
jgi:hypothetical protein